MKIKLDENLPERLLSVLVELGHDVDTVVAEGLKGATDSLLWPAVQRAGRFFLTKDLDFSDARRYEPGTHQGVMVFRLTDDRSSVVSKRLESVFRGEAVQDWSGCLVIVTDHKVRVRRHPPQKTD